MEFTSKMVSCHWAETALASSAHSILSKLDKQHAVKLTAELCQDKLGKSFKISASQESLSDMLGQKAEDDAPIIQKSWMTVQAASFLSHSYRFEAACSVLPAYSGNIYSSSNH